MLSRSVHFQRLSYVEVNASISRAKGLFAGVALAQRGWDRDIGFNRLRDRPDSGGGQIARGEGWSCLLPIPR